MPACLTHYQFAKQVLGDLPDCSNFQETAFYWGAQGPDFLFCDRYFWGQKKVAHYGNLLHEAPPVKTLGAVRDFLKTHADPAYLWYARGLLCHYSLDSTAHPYINAKAMQLVEQRPNETRNTMHGEIEGALDAIILRREEGKLPSEVSLGDCFPNHEPVQRRIALLYQDLIARVMGDQVSAEDLYRCTRDAHVVFSLLTDRTGLKMALFDRVERKGPHNITSHIVPITERDGVDYLNSAHEPWSWAGISGHEDFFELFDLAKALALQLIPGFQTLEDEELSRLTGDRPFG